MPETSAAPLVPNLDELMASLRVDSPAQELLPVFGSAADLGDARRRLRAVVGAWTAYEESA